MSNFYEFPQLLSVEIIIEVIGKLDVVVHTCNPSIQ
jgi:hypothetical protein